MALSPWSKSCRSSGIKARRLEIDLSHPNGAAQVFDFAQDWLGLPEILVNNAAHSRHDGFELLDAAKLDAHYAVNMRATFLLAVEFARRAKSSGRLSGRIINMSSGQNWGRWPANWPTPQLRARLKPLRSALRLSWLRSGLRSMQWTQEQPIPVG